MGKIIDLGNLKKCFACGYSFDYTLLKSCPVCSKNNLTNILKQEIKDG